jgi:hypothetical protein
MLKKMDVVTLIALVIINCTIAQTERKSEEIGIVSVAERFVGLRDFTEGIVAMNAPSSQAPEPV